MNYLNDDDLLLDNKIKFSNAVQNIGDQMARLVFLKKNIVDNDNLLFTYDDFYKKHQDKFGGLNKKSFNSLTKRDNNSNKSILKSSLKKKANKKTSFNSSHDFPIKKVSSGNKSKFSKNNSQDKINDSNNIKDEGNKKYVKYINNRKSVVVNPNYFIKLNDTNPQKIQALKFINKKNSESNNEEKKSSIPENNKINDDNSNNINKYNSFSNNKNYTNKNSINNSKNNTKRNSEKSNKNSSINDKTIKNKSSEFDELDNFDIEIIKSNILEYSSETSNNGSINRLMTDNFNSKLKGKRGSDRLYYIEMRNLKKKYERINKKRTKIIEEKLSHMKSAPKINKNTIDIMAKKSKEYIPIQERAAQIHSKHLTQIILNDLQNKMEKEDEENKEIGEIKKYKNNKKYNEKDWNNFVNSQFQWKDEINFKRKAEEILKYKIYKKNNNKPYMNSQSRNIINKRIKKNASMDNVYIRLYNDFEERGERQEILNNKYIPSFQPLKRNINYKKFINKKIIHKNNSELIITNFNKDNYFLESQISLNGSLNNNYINKNYNCSRNKCKYCYNKNINNKNNIKTNLINNSTIFVNKSTDDNTFRVSKFGTIDSILPTESYISNKNYYNYKNGLKRPLNNNITKGKKQNIIRLNKTIKHKQLNNKYIEEEKQICKENPFYNEIFEVENLKPNKNGKNINKTISIIGNKYKKFFDFDNIENL